MIAVEVRKLLRRPRTWVSVALLCLLPTIVAFFLASTRLGPRPGEGPAFLSAVLTNGALYPAAALGIVLPLFLPIAVAVVAGDSVAGESAAGTLRYLLLRPVGRTRLLVAKLVTIVVFVVLSVLSVAGTAYFVGKALFGSAPLADAAGGAGGVTGLSGVPLDNRTLLWRTALTIAYIGWSMLGVGAVALFLSTLADSPLGAALGALATLVLSQVLVTLDAAQAVDPYLPTRYWLAWVDLFRDPVLWHDISRGVAVQGVYVGVLLALSWANFMTRDVTT